MALVEPLAARRDRRGGDGLMIEVHQPARRRRSPTAPSRSSRTRSRDGRSCGRWRGGREDAVASWRGNGWASSASGLIGGSLALASRESAAPPRCGGATAGRRPSPGAFRRGDLARLHRGAAFRVRHGDRVRSGPSRRGGDPASRSADAAGDGPHRRGEREVRDRPGRGARRARGAFFVGATRSRGRKRPDFRPPTRPFSKGARSS